ncbi:MAG: preprotein translocase subunit SecG [Muribaculaceae bacterium]|jgi:preprotein translocase subunit SecG|nr:preprotein translocase subunit SecG [Muribaculaceae bacterium]MBQ2164006.1 preprotein translocase subunit SecG [Muribaculaceae bacterium]MBQ3910908.1 preprotein translocase subunit SecG [Muribaculaceae bacterium]
MAITLSILIFLASILLIGVVLIQKSKGGGLAASASNYNQFMGVRKTTDFIEKATWGLAIFICVLSIATPFISQPSVVSNKKITLEDMKTQKDQKAPQFPTQQAAPAQEQAPAAQAPAAQAPAAPAEKK